jgi:hypothetical protein
VLLAAADRERDNVNKFTAVTSERMVNLISDASLQVMYAAPAMDAAVADAIVQFTKKTSINQASVMLDCSPDVYREGYGEVGALDVLRENGIQIAHASGLRIGVLIVDGKGYMYAPVSKTQSFHRTGERKNAVIVNIGHNLHLQQEEQGEQAQLNVFDGFADETVMGLYRTAEETASTVMEERVTLNEARMKQLKEELIRQPAPDFSMQQQLSEYRRLIQFVEVTFTGGRLEKTTIRIPSQLLNIAKEKGFEEKIKASYQLFNKDFSIHTKPMTEKVEKFRTKYTRTIPKYGNVILVAEKEKFIQDLQTLQKEIESYTSYLQNEVEKQIQNTKQELINNFTPILQMTPPQELLSNTTEPEVRGYIHLLLSDEIPHAEEVLRRIELHCTFKDITEETLKNTQFYRQLEKAFKDQNILWPHQRQLQEELQFFE